MWGTYKCSERILLKVYFGKTMYPSPPIYKFLERLSSSGTIFVMVGSEA